MIPNSLYWRTAIFLFASWYWTMCFLKSSILLLQPRRKWTEPQSWEQRYENYNFGECVRRKVVESQGCLTPWNLRSEDEMSRCSNVSSMQAYELTGCNTPCTFTQYSLHYSFPLISSNVSEFFMSYALTDLITEKEVLLFPFDSLVSEFGGALGLFLGFSFLGAASTMQTWALCLVWYGRGQDCQKWGGNSAQRDKKPL